MLAPLFPDAELRFRIWEAEWPLIEETLAFKTHPQSQTVPPGTDVSFTCSVDSASPASYQWFHKGIKIPGQTGRSLFLPRVGSGHAGNYFVRATAGDLIANSDSATLTVQTTTPANKDSDADGLPDIHETNTSIWLSATNTGTNPYKWDTDSDGLRDGVETRTGFYLSRSNTGTNPNMPDTDGDGVNDRTEIDRGTDPNTPPAPSGMALIPAGSFSMGNAMGSGEGYSHELPVHTVYVSAFYMDKYEVTKALWDEVANWAASNGYDINAASASGKAANHPAYYVTWYECVKWCNARSQKAGLTPCYTVGGAVMKTGTSTPDCNFAASGYRLPTEAEWEKAARGGQSGKRFPWGDTISHSQANYYSSTSYSYDVSPTRGEHPTYYTGSSPYTSPVGSFAPPNGYGLYDMAGNVWEWGNDWYSSSYYSSSPSSDPTGAPSGSIRVLRGGGWYLHAYYCRVAGRSDGSPGGSYNGLGFRCVRR